MEVRHNGVGRQGGGGVNLRFWWSERNVPVSEQ